MNSKRRQILKAAAAVVPAAAAVSTEAAAQTKTAKKVHYKDGKKPERKPGEKPPLFNGAVSYGNLLFIAGKGAHFKGDITAHTKHVLDEVEKELINAGSSMDKVLKCNVYLADGKDYAAMNEAFRGRFGEEPPVRTTIAAAWIPGDSLVEIDVVAYI
ncbi:MAG TPA: RidA family protein [Blastocatellia bacterium]|nr:RidA family protein [Blastocatellia bacterium]HMV87318.1 RidA family protein [Blastocatellia bacterium]HMX27030.1 RidA family protein [Blastocatellia bacterium]HMZ21443.1 RidA family protein [Blastocatellia bacterium]HNG34563.1 RidA family protein [Blastocatellia bacterium]